MVTEIESMGDPAELSDKGWFKKFFDERMERYSRQVSDGDLAKVGLNIHQVPDEEDTLLKEVAGGKIDPCRNRIAKIREFKKKRDMEKLKEVLGDLHEKGRVESENVMFPIIKATEAGATMGEIAGTLRMAYDYAYDPHGLVESPV